MSNLRPYARNIYSQCGEDGILEELFRRLAIESGYFCEFGAWDGRHLSNAYFLAEHNWEGLMIECDQGRSKVLEENLRIFAGRVVGLNARVEIGGVNSLDNILKGAGCPVDLDLLSIDIDSNDWDIWYSLQEFNPKVVVIESNTTWPPGVFATHVMGVTQGSSFTALHTLGRTKGYVLVCHTGNMIFVREELAGTLGLPPEVLEYPELLFDWRKHFDELRYQRSVRARISRVVRTFLRRK